MATENKPMRTIETTIYTFDELSDAAKKKALDKHRDYYVDDCWWDCSYGNFIQSASSKGYSILPRDIHFTGFSSQGDGACFAGTVRKTSEETVALIHDPLAAKIKLHHSKCRLLNIEPINLELTARLFHGGTTYCHSGTMEIAETEFADHYWGRCYMGECICSDNWPGVCDEREALLREIGLVPFSRILLQEARDLADELYKTLEKEHEHLTSDECITYHLRHNDYEFTEDGDRV